MEVLIDEPRVIAGDALYRATREPQLVQVPRMTFLMVDGTGDPNTSAAFKDAVAALYSLSYTLKFALKAQQGLNYRVSPLEALWWAEDMREFSVTRKADWQWTAMIAQPDAVTLEQFADALIEVRRKKGLPGLDRVRLEPFEEGPAAQVLHLGPYAEEGPTIEKLHRFIREHGYMFDGAVQKHHEIYLGDPRRAAPEKLKTIIRQPVALTR